MYWDCALSSVAVCAPPPAKHTHLLDSYSYYDSQHIPQLLCQYPPPPSPPPHTNRLSYVPQQSWLEEWLRVMASALPRCEPLQLATLSFVLGQWGLVPPHDFSIDFWRATQRRCGNRGDVHMCLGVRGRGRGRQGRRGGSGPVKLCFMRL
jgi:hypothetical protein